MENRHAVASGAKIDYVYYLQVLIEQHNPVFLLIVQEE
jgi:hypothetical protein